MAQLTVEAITKRADSAWRRKELWRSMIEEAYEFGLPQRNVMTTFSEGVEKMDRVFDSTAVLSTIRFANRLQSNLVPAFQQWAELKAGPFIPQDRKDELNKILQPQSRIIFASIHVSNFDTAVNELFLDLATGMGGMLILPGDGRKPIRFVVVPRAQFAIEDGPFGTVGAVYRRHRIKVHLLREQWPDLKDPEGKIAQAESDDRMREADLEEVTYFDAEINRFRYEVILKGLTQESTNQGGQRTQGQTTPQATAGEPSARIVERTFRKNPWIVVRWVKVAGEVEGRGPLLMALPDIRTVNAVVELVLRNAALAVSGVWTAIDDGTVNPDTIAIIPGAVIPVSRNDGPLGPSIAPLPRSGDFDVAQLVLDDMRGRIRAILMDQGLPEQTGSVRSATEIIERVKELQQDIGSPFGRLFSELIVPTIERVIDLLVDSGLMDDIPVDGLGIQVQVTSPLARVQDLNELETTVRWLEIMGSLLGQEFSMLAAKMEDIGAWMGDKMGVDQTLIRDDTERTALQKQAAGFAGAQQTGGVEAQEVEGAPELEGAANRETALAEAA